MEGGEGEDEGEEEGGEREGLAGFGRVRAGLEALRGTEVEEDGDVFALVGGEARFCPIW